MNCSEVIAELKIRASEKYKANMVRMGIPDQYSIDGRGQKPCQKDSEVK